MRKSKTPPRVGAGTGERASEGELRALVALQGSYSLGRGPGDDTPAKWQRLEEAVNTFIQQIEDDGLQE